MHLEVSDAREFIPDRFTEQELMDIMQREEDAREETKKEVAISMYTGGMSEEDIAKFVKLSIEDVRAITRTIEQ